VQPVLKRRRVLRAVRIDGVSHLSAGLNTFGHLPLPKETFTLKRLCSSRTLGTTVPCIGSGSTLGLQMEDCTWVRSSQSKCHDSKFPAKKSTVHVLSDLSRDTASERNNNSNSQGISNLEIHTYNTSNSSLRLQSLSRRGEVKYVYQKPRHRRKPATKRRRSLLGPHAKNRKSTDRSSEMGQPHQKSISPPISPSFPIQKPI
jgi:hypothetical protein